MNLFRLDSKPQKIVRVLVYPNITFQENLEADSFCQVIKKQIKLLNEIRSDLWFYLILPCPVPSLNFDNVTQWFIDFETYLMISKQIIKLSLTQVILIDTFGQQPFISIFVCCNL